MVHSKILKFGSFCYHIYLPNQLKFWSSRWSVLWVRKNWGPFPFQIYCVLWFNLIHRTQQILVLSWDVLYSMPNITFQFLHQKWAPYVLGFSRDRRFCFVFRNLELHRKLSCRRQSRRRNGVKDRLWRMIEQRRRLGRTDDEVGRRTNEVRRRTYKIGRRTSEAADVRRRL